MSRASLSRRSVLDLSTDSVSASAIRTPSSIASRWASIVAGGVLISWARWDDMRRRVLSTTSRRSASSLMVAVSTSNFAPRLARAARTR